MSARVFFARQSRNLDVSSAVEHGVPTYLLTEPASPFRMVQCVEAIQEALMEHSYTPGHDYIAVAGPSIMTSVFVAIAAANGPVRLLLWDAPSERYVSRTMDLSNIDWIAQNDW